MANEHKKHGNDVKARFGQFGRNELAIMGAPCGDIHQLVAALTSQLSALHTIGYLDATHPKEGDPQKDILLYNGAQQTVTSAEDHFQILQNGTVNRLNPKLQLSDIDLLFINGNHFEGEFQIVLLDKRKTDSLKRNQHKLTNMLFFVDADGQAEIPDFVQDNLKSNKAIYDIKNIDAIVSHIQRWMLTRIPKLNGLVLSGGKSTRMGSDKGMLNYHDVPQREYLANLLLTFCDSVFVSTSQGQDTVSDYQTYPDLFLEMGPLGAILTAFKNQPDAAWLVLACDLPLVDAAAISNLVKGRSTKSMATAYQKIDGEFPEPLFAIYEPKIYHRALQMLALGIQCPRKLLINSDVKVVLPTNNDVLTNANTPEERDAILAKVKNGER